MLPELRIFLSVKSHTGFDNNHEIAVPDHIHVPTFWRKWHTQENAKKHISDLLPSDFPNNFS